MLCLRLAQRRKKATGQSLGAISKIHHACSQQFDGAWRCRIQEEHGNAFRWIETLLTHFAQQVAHVHRYFAKIDVDWARIEALMANRAMVCNVLEFLPVRDGDAPARLLFVEERFDQ